MPRSGFGLDELLGGNVAKKTQGWQSLLLSRSRNNRAPPTMPTGHAHAGRARRKREAPSNVAEAATTGASEQQAAALRHEDGVRYEREHTHTDEPVGAKSSVRRKTSRCEKSACGPSGVDIAASHAA
jgi:hypothetical protein